MEDLPVKHWILMVLTLLSVGCGLRDPYSTETAHFVAYNYTADEVVAFIDTKDIGMKEKPMYPNLPTEFTLDVKVPKPARNEYYPTSPSSDDRTVYVSVNFRVTRTGQSTPALSCKAGAKITTRLEFQYVGGKILTSCNAL
jgi:hypothetical protein